MPRKTWDIIRFFAIPARRSASSRRGNAAASTLVNLLRAVTTVSGMTLLSRITGLVRESLKATVFGAGLQMDAFEAAFRLPNILRRMFAEGAFTPGIRSHPRRVPAAARRRRDARPRRAVSGRCSR